jgi:lipoate-protein ligase B
VSRRQRGEAPDTLLLVEHPPVFTLGRRAERDNILVPAERLREMGIEVAEIERGGDVTYHGPGQVVGYPIMDLRGHGRDLGAFLRGLEEVLIRALASYGVSAGRQPPMTGVWVGDEKIAAIGIAVSRWVSYHGFCLNVAPDLGHFALIHPCGIRDRGVTSMEKLMGAGRVPPLGEVEREVARAFGEVFGLEMASGPAAGLVETQVSCG